MYVIETSAKLVSKVKSAAELAMFDPLRLTVNGIVLAVPVPSLMVTVFPIEGEGGSTMVMPPAPTTILSPTYEM